jgi:hypothetical protein
MEYVIPVVLVVLLVGGFVTFLVVNATKKGGPVADAGAPGIGPDETPLGDTTEHADHREGEPQRPARLEREQEPARPQSERLADREA